MAELKFPSGLKYSKEHQWIKVGGDVGIVGITDYAQHQLTDVVFVELPEAGNKIEQGKSYASIESVKSVSDVLSPIVLLLITTIIVSSPFQRSFASNQERSFMTSVFLSSILP